MTDSYTRDFAKVLQAESEYIAERRADIKLTEADLKKFGEKIGELLEKVNKQYSENKWKFGGGKIGLAFSGGGIRSATFNLGMLQALARVNILRFCDYLSTVGGGGYIGSCLSSLLDNPDASVEFDRFPFRYLRARKADERKEVKWLRRHSNCLVLNKDFLRLGSWQFVSFYLSGLVLRNLSTITVIIFLTYFIYLIFQTVDNVFNFATDLFQISLVFFVLMIITQWGSSLRDMGHKGRRLQRHILVLLAIWGAALAFLSGLIMLAFLPELRVTPEIAVPILGTIPLNLPRDLIIATPLGLVAGLIRANNMKWQQRLNLVFRISWILLLPVLFAQLVRILWITDAFSQQIFSIPVMILFAIILLVISLFTNHERLYALFLS